MRKSLVNKIFSKMSKNALGQVKVPLLAYLRNDPVFNIYIGIVCILSLTDSAYADWFNVAQVKTNLITPVYNLVNDNLGFVAFAVGGVATFLARGQDMYQKAMAFGAGSLGTAAAVKLAQTVMNLG